MTEKEKFIMLQLSIIEKEIKSDKYSDSEIIRHFLCRLNRIRAEYPEAEE